MALLSFNFCACDWELDDIYAQINEKDQTPQPRPGIYCVDQRRLCQRLNSHAGREWSGVSLSYSWFTGGILAVSWLMDV